MSDFSDQRSVPKQRDVQVAEIGTETLVFRSRSWTRLRFEREYARQRGTTANSYLIQATQTALIDPPGESFTDIFLEELQQHQYYQRINYIILSHVNPNRIATLKQLLMLASYATVICSKPAANVLRAAFADEPLDNRVVQEDGALEFGIQYDANRMFNLHIVRDEEVLNLGNGHQLQFRFVPTPRHPDEICTYDPASGILFTDKLFGAHVCGDEVFDAHWRTLSDDRRQAFAEFVERPLQTYPGIQALEWAPIVQQTDRPAYEAAVRAEGYPSFQITELAKTGKLVRAGQRPYYVPVTYVEPLAENRSAFGYDLNSDPTRASAIAQARKTGEITATGRIRLVQEQRDQFGFLVFLPLYQNHQLSDSPQLQYQHATGFVLGVFRVSDVVEEALKNLQYEIDFIVYDQSANPTEQFLGRYEAARKQVTTLENSEFDLTRYALCAVPADCTQALTIGNRQWAVVFSPAASYPIEMHYGAIATLLGGLLLTSGLGLFLYRLKRELEQTRTLNDLKFRFFSMASHELRTPLSTILLSSEFLQANYAALSDIQKQSNIQRIHAISKQMSQQITDLLMLTRAEVGKLEFHPELLDLERFCQQIVDEMQPSLNQPIQFISTVQTTKAFLDKKLLQSLLTNLLSNAAKYSPANTPIQFK
ncbi:CHASE domain-containing protein [Leptolyngbya sp. 7M]|uniref:CHASE domain-containing protein n=1 Tax=Leptolyngbya sp. 7M TaxID=2812896 RepID=UPI001B8D18BA|nr:CHASE domain-containing protein [Leptolyngbya sp. 7M]QYO64457.1 CHASE domain-containing protein [Leptolyngbya sp. 7M]